ncbi:hypothetical protein VTN02DRAFT_138, partial [Thermoascus thermophilus]
LHAALVAFQPVFQATCLRDPGSGEYCYVQAAGPDGNNTGNYNDNTNTTNIADSYVYYLPLGMPFPGGSRPSCDPCLRSAMAVFAQAAQIKGQPLTRTYLPAAQLINVACGPGFVATAVDVASRKPVSAAGRTGRRATVGSAVVLGVVAAVLGF